MPDYDVVVIGAGNGGLTAAARLAKGGARVLVLERHNVPGGCATSFCRGRFEFEVALHQLTGMGLPENPGPLRRMLKSLGVLDRLEFLDMNDLYRLQVIHEDIDITLRPSREGVVSELQRRFPREKEAIVKYFDLMYAFFSDAIGAFYMQDPEASPQKYPLYFKYALKSAQEVMDEFLTDPKLKFMLSPYWTYIGLPPRLMTFLDMASMFVGYIELKPYHLKGGSQALSSALAESIIENGGAIRYNCGARRILVRNGRVAGVLTEDGDEIATNFVVSNASKVTTYTDLLEDEDVPDSVRAELRQSTIAESGFVIYMGLDCSPEEAGFAESLNFIFGDTDIEKSYEKMKALEIDDSDAMVLSCYNLRDASFAPPGCSQVALVTLKYGDPWLHVAPGEYYDVKHRVADQMLGVVGKLYPNLRGHIEEMEIATPLTFLRYLGHPRGSIYAFNHHIKDSEIFIPNRPHVKGLYGAGGWVGLCGFQPTLQSGIVAAKQVLRELKG
jgi:phytoene dehydrogenase-like protein